MFIIKFQKILSFYYKLFFKFDIKLYLKKDLPTVAVTSQADFMAAACTCCM